MRKLLSLLILALITLACKEDPLPKPQGYLRLEYPIAKYEPLLTECPYTFGKSVFATVKKNDGCNLVIDYPQMKASIFLSYKTVNGNINQLLDDAQKFTYKHTKKAESILERPYVNPDKKVYGMFYEVGGDAASATQFYMTDSTRHFLIGSVYFNVRPNSDSLLPASEYLKYDIRTLIESLEWK